MKKIISILLSMIMVFSLISVGVSAADETDELKAIVVNDLHYNYTYDVLSDPIYKDKDYSHVSSNGQLWIESVIIIKTFLAEAAQSDCDVILMPGDLTDHGNIKEHEELTKLLDTFEKDNPTKKIFVVPGNHDYHSKQDKITPADFADRYKNFGYAEEGITLANDPNSASYVAKLNDEYRLLAIDSCIPGSGGSGIDEERKAWIIEQAEKAQADGVKLISMMHHNLLDHFVFSEMLHPTSMVDPELGLAEIFAQYNIKYTFSGHTHAHDIKSYTGSNGTTIYDVLTSSLNLYPLPYRVVTFGENVKIRSEFIESIDMTSKKDIISDNCYALATKDFQAYALACAHYGLDKVFANYIDAETIADILNLDKIKDADLYSIIEKLAPKLWELINIPLYGPGTSENPTIEAYAKELGLDLPKTDLETFKDLGAFCYEQYVVGDENFGLFSSEYILITATLTPILNELFKELSAEDYANILNYLASYFKLKKLNNFTAYAGDAISRIQGIEIFVSALGSSVLLCFTTDELPADNFATLPGYDIAPVVEENLTLWDKIINFFLSFFDNILRFFGVGK